MAINVVASLRTNKDFMKSATSANTDDLDKFGHLYGDELRENIVAHYVQKFQDHGLEMKDAKLWVAGTAAATTRREKSEILTRICKAQHG
jgi:hypothetical protein